MNIFAHRGASGNYPENTMIAFEKAIEFGANGIETDVHMTKDGQLVLIHDETVNRTTNGRGFIKDYKYSDILNLDAGIKFNKKFKGERIPKLEELLNMIKNRNIVLNIELKNNIILYDDLERKVIELIERNDMIDKVIISSFNHYAIKKCMRINNNIETGLLYNTGLYKPEIYADFVGSKYLHPYFYAIYNEEIIKGIKNKGIRINTFTVNEVKDMKFFIENQVDGIITNYPERLKNLLY